MPEIEAPKPPRPPKIEVGPEFVNVITRLFRMMSHKGYQVEPDRIKISAESTPQKDKILELSKEEKERILFEREAKVPEPDYNDPNYIRGLPPQL